MEDNKWARRIAALLANAEDAAKRGELAERDAFLEKAQALQLQFAITDAMLPKGDAGKEEVEYADFCQESNTPLIKAKRELVNGLAKLFRGKAIMMGEYERDANGEMRMRKYRGKMQYVYNRRAKVRVYAHTSDLRFIQQMYTSLITQMQTEMAADETREELFVGKSKVANAWRVSYAYAYVRRVYDRLLAQQRRQERAAEDSQPGTALALVDRRALVRKEFEAAHPDTRSAHYREDNDGSGTWAGREAANRVDLGNSRVGATTRGQLEA